MKRQNELLFAIAIGALIFFNVFDVFATILFVRHIDGKELNPLLTDIVHDSPPTFAVIKIGYVLLVGRVLWDHRKDQPSVAYLTFAITGLYGLLFLYQLAAVLIALFIK